MKKILLFLFSALLLVANTFAAEPEPSYDYIFNEEDSDVKVSKKKNPTSEQKQALFIMNYARYVIFKIKTYNNIFALEDEYSNFSDNINLQTVADTEGIEQITQLMHTLSKMKNNHKKTDRLEASLRSKMQQALYDSFQPITTIVTAKANFLSIAINAISTLANMYMSYKKYKNQLLQEFDQSMFELELDREYLLDETQTKLLSVSHTLLHRYNISNDWRITEAQIKKMLECLDDENAGRSYLNLKNMKRHFQHFPTFWYYLAKKASEAGDSANAIKYYSRFEKENIPFFITDKMAVDAYKGKIAIMLKNKNFYKNEILEKLKYIEDNTQADRTDWLNDYFCALVYSQMGRYADAKRLLKANIAKLSAKVSKEFEKDLPKTDKNMSKEEEKEYLSNINYILNELFSYIDALSINRAMLYNFDDKKISKEKQFVLASLNAEFENFTANLCEFYVFQDTKTVQEKITNFNLKNLLAFSRPVLKYEKSFIGNYEINVYVPIHYFGGQTRLTLPMPISFYNPDDNKEYKEWAYYDLKKTMDLWKKFKPQKIVDVDFVFKTKKIKYDLKKYLVRDIDLISLYDKNSQKPKIKTEIRFRYDSTCRSVWDKYFPQKIIVGEYEYDSNRYVYNGKEYFHNTK